ncbi:hypothetical protein PVAP13_5NG065881 [Panicum virgatum]|uniref:Uncharacterized protein n=1 Tax=Panicum virgatum TaxID=38727 RepID=A0A8T0RNA1_PANVG|nr:hypothetical protein PVAP13_5NG065881 [Panicum virgatum]
MSKQYLLRSTKMHHNQKKSHSSHQISSYNFAEKKDYDTILNYKFLTDNNHTFSLSRWSNDGRCFTEHWLIPLTIEIHGIPPYMFDVSSLGALLDPHCDIESYTMNKKTGTCTVEAYAAGIHCIPPTGFISYTTRNGLATSVHSYPVTLKTKFSPKVTQLGFDWIGEKYDEVHSKPVSPPYKDNEENIDSEMLREADKEIFEGESSDYDDPNDAYYYPDSDREPKNW